MIPIWKPWAGIDLKTAVWWLCLGMLIGISLPRLLGEMLTVRVIHDVHMTLRVTR